MPGFGGTIREHFAPDPTSKLYEAICSAESGSCTFPTDVYLPATVPCSGNVECGADILHVVKMVQGDRFEFYKYIEPECVDMQFFRGGKSMVYGGNRRRSGFQDQCADPTVVTRAGVRCCKAMTKPALQYPTYYSTPPSSCACIPCGSPSTTANSFTSGQCAKPTSICSATVPGSGCYSSSATLGCDCSSETVLDPNRVAHDHLVC